MPLDRPTRLPAFPAAAPRVVLRICLVALALASVAISVAQAPGASQGGGSIMNGNVRVPANPSPNRYGDGARLFDESAKLRLDPKQVDAVNKMRLQTMQSETDRMLLLARHLNAEVSKAGTADANPQELAEAAQVERLAHVVQQLMKSTTGN